MKVAVISDIHGNLPALQAVLNDFPPIDACVCCGDVVGYYPDAESVCNLLKDHQVFAIRGNHDACAAGLMMPLKEKAAAYKIGWTRKHLSAQNLSWLRALPLEMRFLWGESRITLRHASPWDENTYLYRDSTELSDIKLKKGEFIILGHTHHPMSIQVGNGMVLNPGSVGQPRDWNPLSSYAIFDSIASYFEIRRVKYNISAYQDKLQDLGWERELIEILSREKPNN